VKLLDSLLDAIVRLEGDALVMHVGEKPYVVTTSSAMNAYRGPLAWGQVELSSRVLTFDAVSSMLAQILPMDQQQALDEYGAIEHEIASSSNLTQRFTVIAARGGEDVWVEVRRKAAEIPVPQPAPAPATPASEPAVGAVPEQPVASAPEPPPIAEAAAVDTPVVEQPVVEAPPVEVAAVEDSTLDAVARDDDEEEEVVVALPDDLAAAMPLDVPLNDVPEHAIQLIDDEPQGVPTEAEVDAMLAATAAALLTSGLAGDDHAFDHVVDDEVIPIETVIPIDDGISDRYDSAEAPISDVVRLEVTPISYGPPESAFELSPPLASIAVLDEETYETGQPEFAYERPVGTPLFSEEAVLAAAAGPELVERTVPEVEQAPIPELGYVDVTPAPPVPSAEAAHEEPPSADHGHELAIGGDAGEPIDLDQQVAVWSAALNEWSTPPISPAEELPASVESSVAEHVEPETAPRSPVPVAESPMEVTSEAPSQSASQVEQEPRSSAVPPAAASAPDAPSAPFTPAEDAALTRTLRAAAARGAATLYVVAQSKPMIRVEGEISALDEPALSAAEVERLITELAPPRKRDALQQGPVEWLCDVPEVGRVRCLTFKDHRGPGVLFHMFPQRAIAGEGEHPGLPAEVRALCQQSDGLVLVAGGRGSGKSTLLNAFVDLVNRTRSDHIITIESQIGFVHESRRSFVSQRETRGDAELAAGFVKSALHEDPDVMVIEDLKTPEAVAAAIEAAESGRLVLASIQASSSIGALERIIEAFPSERQAKIRASLAHTLRGVVAQVLLRRVKGGRVVAREILLNTPAVANLVVEGKTFELPGVLEGGRQQGMMPLTDSLAAQVREGTVHPAEAYRKAQDRAALVNTLKRDGIDTSFAELLA
jgi:twitching motility protein PilT